MKLLEPKKVRDYPLSLAQGNTNSIKMYHKIRSVAGVAHSINGQSERVLEDLFASSDNI